MVDAPDPALLKAFVAVAEHGSLTRAAAALGLAQSVLSRRLGALEARLGLRLFHRTGRGAQPTDEALRLLPRARGVLLENDALLADARGETRSPAGRVEIAVVPAVSRPLVVALVKRLRRDLPRVQLRAHEAYSGQVEAWLASGHVDIGLFNRYSRAAVRHAEPLFESDVVLVARRDSRFAPRAATLPFRDLQGVPLVLPARPNALVSAASDIAARHGFLLDLAVEAGSPTIIRDLVHDAGLTTLLPAHLARREYPAPAFAAARVVRPALLQRTWLAGTPQRAESLAVRAVWTLVRELAPRLAR